MCVSVVAEVRALKKVMRILWPEKHYSIRQNDKDQQTFMETVAIRIVSLEGCRLDYLYIHIL